MRRLVSLIAALAIAAAACGGTDGAGDSLPDDALVFVVSGDLAIGQHRVAVAAINDGNESLVTEEEVGFEYFRSDGTPAGNAPARFIWAIPEVRGMWVSEFDFDASGIWTLGVRTTDDRLVMSAPFSVAAETASVTIGDPAPASETKTLASNDLREITTDTEPDERFYQLTVAQAVASGRPSVIVFATPAFCTSATCGPSLEVAKTVARESESVDWVHVEVFDNLDAATFDELVVVPAIEEWGLLTEPWVFVTDSDGVVTARFEGAIDETELRTALAAVGG